MNRTIVDLLALNVNNLTQSLNADFGLVLMAYPCAVQTYKGYSHFFLLFGREMHLPLDNIYRQPERERARHQYVADVLKIFEDA